MEGVFCKWVIQHGNSQINHTGPKEEMNPYELRQKYINKKYLTYKEISDSEFWGYLTKKGVYATGKKMLEPHEIIIKKGAHHIPVSAVRRVAKIKNIL